MYDLIAIVRATRASAKALSDCQKIARTLRETAPIGVPSTALVEFREREFRKLCLAERRYQRAQQILAANPLPGDYQ